MNWREPASLLASVTAHGIFIILLSIFVSIPQKDTVPRTIIDLEVMSGAPVNIAPVQTDTPAAGEPVKSRTELKTARPHPKVSRKRPPVPAKKRARQKSSSATDATTQDKPVLNKQIPDTPAKTQVQAQPDHPESGKAARAVAVTAENKTDSGDADSAAPGSSPDGTDSMSGGNGEGIGGTAGGTGHGGVGGGTAVMHRSSEADRRIRRYALLVRRTLEKKGAYPRTARRLGIEGLVRMRISVDGRGNISSTEVLRSSGYPDLDRAALASADRINRLPAPPGGQPVDILVPVRFSLRR